MATGLGQALIVRGFHIAGRETRDGFLKGYGISSSMSRRGNCWDNACSEMLFGSLKVERLYGQKLKTRREKMADTIAWQLRYNRTRLHSTVANISPVQFEQNWLANTPTDGNLIERNRLIFDHHAQTCSIPNQSLRNLQSREFNSLPGGERQLRCLDPDLPSMPDPSGATSQLPLRRHMEGRQAALIATPRQNKPRRLPD